MQLKLLMKWAAIGWTIAIFIGCLMPLPAMAPTDVTLHDKAIHGVIFGLWVVLWITVQRQPFRFLLLGVLFGFGIECLQGIMPLNRHFDWMDLFDDSVGAVIGALIGTVWTQRVARG